jgi:hypothetical protein
MFSLLQYVHEITTLSYGFIYPFQLKATQAGFLYASDITSNSTSGSHQYVQSTLMLLKILLPQNSGVQ